MTELGPRGHPTPWSPEDELRLLALVKEGYGATHIALQFGCKAARITDKLKSIRGYKPRRSGGKKQVGHKRKLANATVRICMTCRRDFLSEGIHNRMCGNCKATA